MTSVVRQGVDQLIVGPEVWSIVAVPRSLAVARAHDPARVDLARPDSVPPYETFVAAPMGHLQAVRKVSVRQHAVKMNAVVRNHAQDATNAAVRKVVVQKHVDPQVVALKQVRRRAGLKDVEVRRHAAQRVVVQRGVVQRVVVQRLAAVQ